MQEVPEYTKAEKIVNTIAKVPLALFSALAFIVRKIRKPFWDRKDS